MEGCVGNTVKYLLFATNFLVFILGCAVLGVGIWVLVDSSSFMDLFKQVEDILGDTDISINIYSTASYLLIAVAVIVIIITFFGCCGAIKESKCMLGTYFAIVLTVFIMCIVGAVLGYSGNLEETIKTPFLEAIKQYDDKPSWTPESPTPTTPEEVKEEAKYWFKEALNKAQTDFKCCGINGVADWVNENKPDNANWDPAGLTPPINKPEGCCKFLKNGAEITLAANITLCRQSKVQTDDVYNFNGCYPEFEKKIKENQDMVVGIAIGVVVVMFLNMLFAFAMCTMSGK